MTAYHAGRAAAHISLSRTRVRDVSCCKRRILFFTALCVCAYAGIAARAVTISRHDFEPAYARRSAETAAPLLQRRTLTDRNGQAIAVNVFTSSVFADPLNMPDKDEAARRLKAALPDMREEHIRSLLHKRRRFVWIKRHLTPKEEKALIENAVAGVRFKPDEKRAYPYKHLFSHALGYVDVDGRGIAGAERYFNELLNKHSYGSDEQALSLDVGVQHAVRYVMAARMKEYQAKAAGAIVTDVRTGEILSLVSLPDFDPHFPGEASDRQKFNVATLGVYEPGSVFKIFNSALALEEKAVSPRRKLDVTEPLRIGKYRIRDYHMSKDPLDMTEILMKSSNIGSAKIALEIAPKKQRGFLDALGLTKETALELPERAAPLKPQGRGKIYRATLSYGHGIAVTPVHTVQAAAAMVNGGILYPATLLKKNNGSAAGVRVISEETSKKLRRMLRLAVEYGTGKQADVPYYLVGGKTGTADKAKNGAYGDRRIISSFFAAFPMHNPRYAVYVMLDEPKLEGKLRASGGNTAAPAAGEIIRRIAPMLDVPPVDESRYDIRELFRYTPPDSGRGNRA